MSLVTLAEAKLHLRVDHTDEDTLIQLYINAAEFDVANTLQRNIYADSAALSAAIATTATAFGTAAAAYDAAMEATALMTDENQRDVAITKAGEDYFHAIEDIKRINRGIVINDAIRSAVLLQIGNLYANRESVSEKNIQVLPMACQWLLQPYQAHA